jgi:hypothetical protein
MVRELLPGMCYADGGLIIAIGSSDVQQPLTTFAVSSVTVYRARTKHLPSDAACARSSIVNR